MLGLLRPATGGVDGKGSSPSAAYSSLSPIPHLVSPTDDHLSLPPFTATITMRRHSASMVRCWIRFKQCFQNSIKSGPLQRTSLFFIAKRYTEGPRWDMLGILFTPRHQPEWFGQKSHRNTTQAEELTVLRTYAYPTTS